MPNPQNVAKNQTGRIKPKRKTKPRAPIPKPGFARPHIGHHPPNPPKKH